ncbi:MAG: GGDEF domain-containing protein [Aquificaceae bacterium]|nr:GGDEF domain-containing protein [Aquificaceae bacterium]
MRRVLLFKLFMVLFLAFLFILAIFTYTFRSQALGESKERARIISEIVRDTLTSYMVMGVIDRRDEFLSRIAEIEGVKEIRVIRGENVIKQFGSSLDYEVPRDDIERQVLASGRLIEQLNEGISKVEYRVVIPYKAVPVKGVDCLQCHKAKPGENLGAISLKMDLTHIRWQTAKVLFWSFVLFVLALGGVALFVGVFLTRITNFLNELVCAMKSASEGSFTCQIKTDPGYEASLLKTVISSSFHSLQHTLSNIEEKVRTMIGYGVLKTGNALSDTSKIVDELLNIYKFKRVIEKDKFKKDVYQRIKEVLGDYMSLENFSLYEVKTQRNTMEKICVNGAESWCKEVILENADECRAKRTGADVDSREFTCICPNFIDDQACKSGTLKYYCIPVYVGGVVGNVVQVVYEPDMEYFINIIIPYIKGYLNEAAPVLEARTYMDLLREQSLRDQLTGLYNRRFLEETIDKIVAQTKRRGAHLGILILDVDYFKQVNDTYGHDVGDRVLREVSQIILKNVRESDIVVRFGGEEFLVLLLDVQPGKSEDVAEKIRRAMENHTIEMTGLTLKKTISIGVAEFPNDSDRIWQCIKFADVALYKAKSTGRNRVVRFKPEFWSEAGY